MYVHAHVHVTTARTLPDSEPPLITHQGLMDYSMLVSTRVLPVAADISTDVGRAGTFRLGNSTTFTYEGGHLSFA